jgi:putative nucleotidyltransferase with HDIG domain
MRGLFQTLTAVRNTGANMNIDLIKESWEKTKSDKRLFKAIMMIRNYDLDLYNHSVMTAELSLMIAEHMKTDIERAFLTGLYHDYGKIILPKSIVNKPGIYNDIELDIMKTHPFQGYAELRRETGLPLDILVGVLDHHERINGSGYGYEKFDAEISQLGKLVAVADVFTAMTAKRIYRKEMISKEEAKSYIIDNEDILFAPNVVRAFTDVIDDYIEYQGSNIDMKTLQEKKGIL